jgi:hypothetical protein
MMPIRSIALRTLLVSIAACSPMEQMPPAAGEPAEARLHEGIRYRAESQLLERDPQAVLTVVTVVNASDEHREITFPDGCTVLIRAYTDEARTEPPAWDQERVAVCTLALQIVQLAAGDSVQYRMEASVPEILGDTLPPGRYHLGALLRPDTDRIIVPAGLVELRR